MRAAAIAIALAAAGCNIVFGFDDIHPGPDAAIDSPGPGPQVFSSPGPRRHAAGYDFVKPVVVTLAADDPAAVIYYTTDGSMPTVDSPHAMTPITGISIAATATLSYFGTAANGTSPIVSDAYYIDSSKQNISLYHVTNITLDGVSPVVVVHAGQALSGGMAKVQAWVQGACPMCAAQVVYGVDDIDQGCLFDTVRDDTTGPGVYPGFTRTATFTITAPTTPGIHPVRITHSEQSNCAVAMMMNALVNRPDLSRIGVLIVQ